MLLKGTECDHVGFLYLDVRGNLVFSLARSPETSETEINPDNTILATDNLLIYCNCEILDTPWTQLEGPMVRVEIRP